MSKKFKNKACVYCGEKSETGDHVIARSFFPEELRAGLPQVPACLSCNGVKSDLETYLAAVLPIAGNHAVTKDLRERVGRSIAKNAKLQREIVEGFDKRRSVSMPDTHATDFRGHVLLDYASMSAKAFSSTTLASSLAVSMRLTALRLMLLDRKRLARCFPDFAQ